MNQVPHATQGRICPLHRRDMSKVCHTCPLWVHLIGKHPQTGEHLDEWNCSLAWLPMLLIEGAQQSRQTGAAVESFRNEMVRMNSLNGAISRLPEIGPATGLPEIEGPEQ